MGTFPLALVASCESFDSTSSPRDAGPDALFDDGGVSRDDASAGPDAGAVDAAVGVRCHKGDLLYNVGFEASACGTSLQGNGVTQSPTSGHDSATACVVCGTSGLIKASAPSLRQTPLKPGRYVAEAWVQNGGDAGAFSKVSLFTALFPTTGGGYAVGGGQTAPSASWACIFTPFEVPADAGAGANIDLYLEGNVGAASRACFAVDDFGIYPADGTFEPCTCH